MATRKQLVANSGNAMESTGPRTIEGKKKVALNALRHGLTSQTVLLPDEDPAEFERRAREMTIDRLPKGPLETALAQRITHILWRLRRVPKIEAGILRGECARIEADGARAHVGNLENVGAEAFAESVAKDILEKLRRYEVSLERSLSRAIRDLMYLQDRRREQERDPQTRVNLLSDRIKLSEDLFKELRANSKMQELGRIGSDVPPKTEVTEPPRQVDAIERKDDPEDQLALVQLRRK